MKGLSIDNREFWKDDSSGVGDRCRSSKVFFVLSLDPSTKTFQRLGVPYFRG